MRIPSIESLARDRGWNGIAFSCIFMATFYLVALRLPDIYEWFAMRFLSRIVVIDPKRHAVVMYLADLIVTVVMVINLVYAIRLLRNRKDSSLGARTDPRE